MYGVPSANGLPDGAYYLDVLPEHSWRRLKFFGEVVHVENVSHRSHLCGLVFAERPGRNCRGSVRLPMNKKRLNANRRGIVEARDTIVS